MSTRVPRSRRPSVRTGGPSHVQVNRRLWEKTSDSYESRHRAILGGQHAEAWGLWRVPESALKVLGPVRGKDVLELGCGAAGWAISLRRRGARVVGFDLSPRHLGHAASAIAAAKVHLPLVAGNAEWSPFRAESFDLVFCDWGALTFADPMQAVPEVARVLRPGGVLAFATGTPFRALAQDRVTDRIGARLRYDYFTLHQLSYPDEVNFQLPYSGWVRLFRDHGLEVEFLHETRPDPGQRSSYLSQRDEAWARRWPMEAIWKVRKSSPRRRAPGNARRAPRSHSR